MKKYCNILIVILLLLYTAKLNAEEELRIAFDAATFFFDDVENKWELYYSVPDNMFTYEFDENLNLFIGKISVEVSISSSSTVVVSDSWVIPNTVESTNALKQNYIFGTRLFLLASGQYEIQLSAYDINNPKRKLSYSNNIIISKFEKNRINQSEIQFASYLEKISESPLELDHSYMKYDYYVIPNPRAEFYGSDSKLMGIYEIYNSDIYAKGGMLRSYKILDNAGSCMVYHADTCKIISDNILTTFSLPMDTLPSGVYFLSVTSSYPLDNPIDSVTSTKKFFFYNQFKPPVMRQYFTENELFERSEFNSMSTEQTDLELAMAMVISSEEEIYQARSLTDPKAKQRFLFKFWESRNPDSTLAWNQALRDFRRNVEFANKFFAFRNNNQGWKTERGRILLKYGMPTQRDMHIATGEERPYEEWFYENVQGGVQFFFVDISQMGNFILVHSTAINEPFNLDWYDRYVPASRDKRIERDLQNTNQRNANPLGNRAP
ncbi:MAG: GWxTD domain-containing protein [Candidatus Kapabacteria bacterium]|nr:GWxTD domain-containing protein [Ignavibacteriota bacterium]MCW5883908.1 GWxTD domain-containing protein [Candidatus Kapabacteria bacterium]